MQMDQIGQFQSNPSYEISYEIKIPTREVIPGRVGRVDKFVKFVFFVVRSWSQELETGQQQHCVAVLGAEVGGGDSSGHTHVHDSCVV